MTGLEWHALSIFFYCLIGGKHILKGTL